ncbi:heavy-metal-associated domain-containing protein [Anaerosolibacter sp.]|uniref:heavy-metal-associated domain-containing protein n=1 Tax=Anaerosolibacter sp. TaxID=1872527 RepID=UPI0039EE1E23
MIKRSMIVIISLVLLLLFVTGCNAIEKDSSKSIEVKNNTLSGIENSKQNEQYISEIFIITGFTRASCADTAQAALSGLDGVKTVTVESTGETVIIYDANRVNMELIEETLEKYRYGVREIQ